MTAVGRRVETEFHRHLDPSVASVYTAKDEVHVLDGVESVQEIVVPQTGGGSQTNISFQNTLGDSGLLLDRTIFLRHRVIVTATASEVNSPINLQTLNFIPAANPLMRACSTLNMRINGLSKAFEPHELVNALSRYHNKPVYNQAASTSPKQADEWSSANMMGGTVSRTAFGSATHPSNSQVQERRAYKPDSVTITTAAADGVAEEITLVYTFTEEIMNPFTATMDENDYFAGVRTLSLQMTMSNALACFVNCKNGPVVATQTDDLDPVTFAATFDISAPELLLRTKTPSVSLPSVSAYDVSNIISYKKELQTLALNAEQTVQTGSMSFGSVPDSLYFFVRPTAQITDDRADGFLTITKVSITPTSGGTVLSDASQEQLFSMCARNGIASSWSQFSTQHGSIIKVQLPTDLGGWVPNSMSEFTFRAAITCVNNTYSARLRSDTDIPSKAAVPAAIETAFTLYTVGVYSSKLYLDGSGAYETLGMSNDEIMELQNMAFQDSLSSKVNLHEGAGFFKDFSRGLKKGFRSVMKPAATISNIAGLFDPRAKEIGDKLTTLNKLTGGTVSSGGGVHSGGVVSGGSYDKRRMRM